MWFHEFSLVTFDVCACGKDTSLAHSHLLSLLGRRGIQWKTFKHNTTNWNFPTTQFSTYPMKHEQWTIEYTHKSTKQTKKINYTNNSLKHLGLSVKQNSENTFQSITLDHIEKTGTFDHCKDGKKNTQACYPNQNKIPIPPKKR